MSVLGIIAEYDPFHNGHLYHLRSATETVSPSAVLVALSGPFKQRGEPALLSPFDRADCVLDSGADAVFALPVLWTVRDAEHYALGAVSLLSSLGATHLAFGAETADYSLLQRTADLLEDSPPLLRSVLHAALACGKGYPAALAEAAGACIPESTSLLKHANNILAVCYLRAIRRLGIRLSPVIIHRSGNYRAEKVNPSGPSASFIRDSLQRGDWQSALSCLPEKTAETVRAAFLSGHVPSRIRMDAVLLEKIRAMTPVQASCLPDCPEGLDTALLKAAACSDSQSELVDRLTTRRYSAARISRLCVYALLGITRSQLEQAPLPDAVMLLAMKKNLSWTGPWKNSSVRILTAARWQEAADPADLASWRIWSAACGLPGSYPYTRKIVSC